MEVLAPIPQVAPLKLSWISYYFKRDYFYTPLSGISKLPTMDSILVPTGRPGSLVCNVISCLCFNLNFFVIAQSKVELKDCYISTTIKISTWFAQAENSQWGQLLALSRWPSWPAGPSAPSTWTCPAAPPPPPHLLSHPGLPPHFYNIAI